MRFDSNGNGEDEADEKRSPEIPIPKFSDSSLSIPRYHEKCELDLGANTKKLSFLKLKKVITKV